MFLELSEAFVCPRCRPAQGLVVLVDRIEGRRVWGGSLGCPECGLRVPIEDRIVRFDRARPGTGSEAGGEPAHPPEAPEPRRPPGLPPVLGGGDPGEGATALAALLAADEVEGYLLLAPGLEELAPGVARRAAKAEVLALTDRPREAAEGVTWTVHPAGAPLPLFTGRLAGTAFVGASGPVVSEAVRVVRPGGRVVLVEPGSGADGVLEELPASTVTRQEGVVVLERVEGGFEEPFARFRGGPKPRREEP